ncbi:hypothetical protein M8818_001896 [Zalaria obscura]|uniref:Uncharacterized protein n=1 Tax=Zalaria obscura TaxID=2024903 RepID=A0ACC3SJ08_9PEZI
MSPRQVSPGFLPLPTEALHAFHISQAQRDDSPQQSPRSRSPLPSVAEPSPISNKYLRPETPRRSTDPLASPPSQAHFPPSLSYSTPRTRNRSPYSRSHLRSRSTSGSLSAPPMARAHSLPSVHTAGHHTLGTSSPLRSPQRSPRRVGSPFRDEAYPGSNTHSGLSSPSPFDGPTPTIDEDAELVTPLPDRNQLSPLQHNFANPSSTHSLSPYAQPLYQSSIAPTRTASTGSLSRRTRPASPLHSGASSPSLQPQRFMNEAYPTLHHFSSVSSMSSTLSSTPSSARSRSPSISSLETIEDVPDLESAALAAEKERLERIKEMEEEEDEEEDGEPRRRSSFESGRGVGATGAGAGFGFRRGGDGARKRWSICGGERRADLDLETIWED